MKIIRYEDTRGAIGYAVWQETQYVVAAGDLYTGLTATVRAADVARVLAPIEPPSIYGIGLNYRQHAAESNMAVPERPIVFFKPGSSLQHPDQPIVLPPSSSKTDYECELAIVMGLGPNGKPAKNVKQAEALSYVLGYTCANDVSSRDWQLEWGGGQWCRGKSFDTFTPLGPVLATPETVPDPNALRISTTLNGAVVQDSNTADMIFGVADIISFLSHETTLLPGTVILTGTPQGVGMGRKPQLWLKAGDEVTIEVEGIGKLTNPVVAST